MNPPTPSKLPRWLLLALGVAFLVVYTHGMARRPVKWEEPRRCLIAMEMIERGDYLVPRLSGRPYFNKPPLQSWSIVLLSGADYDRVGAATVRGVTLIALLAIALLLWRLGAGGPDVMPAVVWLTFSVIVQHGWAGELDVLFTFWVTAALAAFEFGRRGERPWVQWGLSQALLAGGVLTKGLAPLFFYPPVLLLTWRRRDVRFAGVPLVVGALAMLGLVAAWVGPYALHGPLDRLVATLSDQVSERTVDQGGTSVVLHVLTYPVLAFGVLLPWSVVALGFTPRRWWAGIRQAWSDPESALAITVVTWGILFYGFVPGGRGRYLIPVLPWAALLFARLLRSAPRRDPSPHGGTAFRVGSAVLAGVWIVYVGAIASRDLHGPPLVMLGLAGLAVVVTLVAARHRSALRSATAILIMVGLLYGLAYRMVSEEREARRGRPFTRSGERLADALDDETPIVVHPEMDRRAIFALAHHAGRTPRVDRPTDGPFAWIVPAETAVPVDAERIVDAGLYVAWRIPDPDALARSVVRPDLTPAARKRLVDQRYLARRQYDRFPDRIDAVIEFARLNAALEDDATAVNVYTRALERRPDDPRLLRHRGESLMRLGRLDDAIDDLERAQRNFDAQVRRGDVDDLYDGMLDQDPESVARSPVQRALGATLAAERVPTTPAESLRRNIGFHLGLALYLAGDASRAEATLAPLASVTADDAESRFWLAMARCRGDLAVWEERVTTADALAERYRAAIRPRCAGGESATTERRLRALLEDHADTHVRRWEVLAARLELLQDQATQ